MIHVGDFNYDGLADSMLFDAESGTVTLHMASLALDKSTWFTPHTCHLLHIVDLILCLFMYAGSTDTMPQYPQVIKYLRYSDSPILHQLEDPIASTLFDVDESDRQDILMALRQGTQLI